MVEQPVELIHGLRLMVILDDSLITLDRFLEAGVEAKGGGATSLQVRCKRTPAGEVSSVTRLLVDKLDIPVFVNDRVDVAVASGAAGVHLGADDLPINLARKVPGADRLVIGASVGTEEEAAAARGADYWGTGPCFASSTKADAGAALGPEGFAHLKRLAPSGVPVLGIGGINGDNCNSIVDAGAVGVAVISAVLASGDIRASTRAIRRKLDPVSSS